MPARSASVGVLATHPRDVLGGQADDQRPPASSSSGVACRLRWSGAGTPTASNPARVRQLIGRPSIDSVPAVATSTSGRWARSAAPAMTERVALPVQRNRMLIGEVYHPRVSMDLVIEVDNEPGALARVATAISDAGVNISAATCVGPAPTAELHILVPHADAAKRALALSQLAVTREREVVVVEVDDRPGVLADLARAVAEAGVDLDLVYVATRNRVVFGSPDLAALKAALGQA